MRKRYWCSKCNDYYLLEPEEAHKCSKCNTYLIEVEKGKEHRGHL